MAITVIIFATLKLPFIKYISILPSYGIKLYPVLIINILPWRSLVCFYKSNEFYNHFSTKHRKIQKIR